MTWPRRAALLASAAALLLAAQALGSSTSRAEANPACAVANALNGGVSFGNPLGDACDVITGVAGDVAGGALKDVAGSIGNSVFEQISSWVADGAIWLLGRVSALTVKTTSPDLLSKGFLSQYRKMAAIAVLMATLMLLFAVIEGAVRGDLGMLLRVCLLNLPLAAIATSAAFVFVQLLLGATDVICHAISASTEENGKNFFEGAIKSLGTAGREMGEPADPAGVGAVTGQVDAPLFVGFIAATVAAFGAFFVWIELLMRDAAVYVVALFLPMAIAAAIWPRWSAALRRTSELLCVIVFSKFVIVAIIALAASLLAHAEGEIEQVLAAGALLLLACFSPLVLFRLVPFAESAASAAHGRQSAAGGAIRGAEFANTARMMHRTSETNWSRFGVESLDGGTGGASSGGAGGGSAGAGGSGAGIPGRLGAGLGSGGEAAGGSAASSGIAGSAAAPAAPIAGVAMAAAAAAQASKSAGERLGATAVAQENAGGGAPAPNSTDAPVPTASEGKGASAARPKQDGESATRPVQGPEPAEAEGSRAPSPGQSPPRPPSEPMGSRAQEGEKK